MKNYILAGLLSLLVLPAAAQFQVGSAETPSGGRAGALESEDLETFRKSTTVFVVQKSDAPYLDMFRKSIADVWTITPFRVVTPDSARFFKGKKFSMFNFGGFDVSKTNSRTQALETSSTHDTYDLTIPNIKKNGETDGRTIMGRFIVGLNYSVLRGQAGENGAGYTSGRYTNWGPGQIRGNLKAINDFLGAEKRRGITEETTDKQALQALRSDTLYLPNYLMNLKVLNSKAKSEEDAQDDAADAYPFPHRYVTTGELEQLLVNATKPVYHIFCVLSIPYKYIAVVEAKSGQIVYSRFGNLGYSFKMKDLKALAKTID